MRSRSNSGIRPRPADRDQKKDPQRDRGRGPGQLYIVGIGPGAAEHLSLRAGEVLKGVDTVVGYTTYIDLIRPLIGHKEIISTGMKKEVDRIAAAIECALAGKRCAIVSSGDAGIYAMAGLSLEMCKQKSLKIASPGHEDSDTREPADKADILVEVVPGIPALCSGAALLGAPLTHDFAAISLSDLLTPWEKIEKRLEAAAAADFVIVLYNPKSKKRNWQLNKAQEIILKHRDGRTPVGIVTKAMRADQRVHIVTLSDLHQAEVDMLTTVFIGNSNTFEYLGFLITPRGYDQKYGLNR